MNNLTEVIRLTHISPKIGGGESSLALLPPTQKNCDGIIVSVHKKLIQYEYLWQRIGNTSIEKCLKKDKDNASSNKKRHSKVENGKDKDEVVCIGQCGKLERFGAL